MYVYIIRSGYHPEQTYIGLSKDYKKRFQAHNNGQSKHTSKYKPWNLETVIWFADEEKARKFEQYLKTGSGRAFRNRHF
ncbi:MAG: GIY-YIG nuclease family protein [Proteobacteria bacterium]|nr:GIY-YIG nuclease family protein [Pseudomonadota bacterium]